MLNTQMSLPRYFLVLALAVWPCWLPAQEKVQDNSAEIRMGNDAYAHKDYTKAEQFYSGALKRDEHSYTGAFNLGAALYQQGKYEAAAEQYQEALKDTRYGKALANTYYNMGNAFLKASQTDKAIDAYKNALRRNPEDADAKYNLSYALAKKKKDQQQQQPSAQNNKSQSQQGQKDKQQAQQGQKGQQEMQAQQQSRQHEQDQAQLSPEETERVMNALRENEIKIRQRMGRMNRPQQSQENGKPW